MKPRIRVFLSRIEFFSPGALPKPYEELLQGDISLPRNPLIMDLLLRMRLVEKIGSGIKRIKEVMEEYGISVVFEVSEHWFSVIFQRKIETSKKGGQILSERQKEILAIIGKKPTITREELCEALKINSSAVQKHMVILKKKGLIKRVGPDKGGYWEVVKP